MTTPEQTRFVEMLKTLADENRLRLLQFSYEEERTVGELAERVGLSESTTSHHLSRLHKMQLVSLRTDGNRRYYRGNNAGLIQFKQWARTIEKMPVRNEPPPSDNRWIAELGWPDADQQILIDHTYNGQITRLPVRKRDKLNVILRWLATLFEPNVEYTEREVNDALKDVYEADYVSLRRDMVDLGYLRRERGGGNYWLAPE